MVLNIKEYILKNKNKIFEKIVSEFNIKKEVVISIKSERDYQEKLWNKDTTSSAGIHTNSEFLVFIQDYLNEAVHIVSRNPEPKASEEASHVLRKITAMAIACAEKNKWLDVMEDEQRSNVHKNVNIVQSLSLIQHCINKSIESIYLNNSLFKTYISLIFNIGCHAMSNTGFHHKR
jgi:hypothetical protein